MQRSLCGADNRGVAKDQSSGKHWTAKRAEGTDVKLGRLPIAIAAVVLLGAVAAGLVDVKEVLASEPTPTPISLGML